jgi:O-antigen/teichoic acid export membrane protein
MDRLKKLFLRGIKFQFAEKVVLFFFSLIQLIVVARYVDEKELGVMALANMVILFASFFSEQGLGNSIVHFQNESRETLSYLFWWFVASGVIVTLILLLSAYPVGMFFESPLLEEVLYVLALTIFIGGLGNLHFSLLYKKLRFKAIAIVRMSCGLAQFLVTVYLAVVGWGVWAIVLGILVKSMIRSIVFLLIGRTLFLPVMRFKFKGIRHHVEFGIFQLGENMVTTIHQQIDILIIGKLMGEEVLGIYDVLKRLLIKGYRMINPIVTTVLLPIFGEKQGKPGQVLHLYFEQIRYLSLLNFPVYIFLANNIPFLFEYVLNPEWYTSDYQILAICLCVFFLLSSLMNPMGTIVISHGLVKQAFIYNLFVALIFPFLIWIVIFTTYSIIVLGGFFIIAQCFMVYFSFQLLLFPVLKKPFHDYVIFFLPILIISILAFLPIGLFLSCWLNLELWLQFILDLIIGGVAYLLMIHWYDKSIFKNAKALFWEKNLEP